MGEVEHDIDFDDAGNIVLKKKVKVRMGRKSRAGGGAFEVRVRNDLEEKGWVVDKWSNNIVDDKLVPCRRKFNPFNKVMTIGTGFPDFVCFQIMKEGLYKVIGVEVKMNGNLSRVEKEKCAWYLSKGIFSEIWVASRSEDSRGSRKSEVGSRKNFIKYVDARRILSRMRTRG